MVTGGGRGIGASIVAALLELGYGVVALDRDEGALEALASAVTRGGALLGMSGDARDPDTLGDACAQAGRKWGRLSGFVANAGISRTGSSASSPRAEWDEVIDVNLSAVFEGSRAAASAMTAGGAIVVVSSILGVTGFGGRAAYSASKAGVLGLARSLAVEWAPRNIRVNAVVPGFIETDIFRRNEQSGVISREALTDRIPLGRLGGASDVADAVTYLVGDTSSYVTGQSLVVDGGWLSFGLQHPEEAVTSGKET